VVDDLAGGLLGIAGKLIGFAGAVEEFVAEEAALGVENGLTAEEAVGAVMGGKVRGAARAGVSDVGRGAIDGMGSSQARRSRNPLVWRFTLFIGASEISMRGK